MPFTVVWKEEAKIGSDYIVMPEVETNWMNLHN